MWMLGGKSRQNLVGRSDACRYRVKSMQAAFHQRQIYSRFGLFQSEVKIFGQCVCDAIKDINAAGMQLRGLFKSSLISVVLGQATKPNRDVLFVERSIWIKFGQALGPRDYLIPRCNR